MSRAISPATRILALAGALGLGASLACAQGTQAPGGLRWRLAQGDRLPYRVSWRLEQTQEIPNVLPPQVMLYAIDYALDQEVTAVEGGVASIRATIGPVRVEVQMGLMGGMSYDSTQDTPDNPMRAVRHLVGESFSYQLDATGRVLGVEGGDALRERVMAKAKEELGKKPARGGGGMGMGDPAAMGGQLASQVTVIFNDRSLATALGLVNEVLPPDAAAGEGTTWERSVEANFPQVGTLRYTSAHRHQGLKDGQTSLTSRVKGEVELVQAEQEAGAEDDPMTRQAKELRREMTKGMQVKRKAATGIASFDGGAGRLLRSEITVEIDSEGPPPPMMKMMLGEDSGDVKMQQGLKLTLTYARS